MKKISLLFYLAILSFTYGKSQNTFIQKNEILQVFNNLLDNPNIKKDYFNIKGYIVKIINESNIDSYSIAITSIIYKEELPIKIDYCFILKQKCFFVVNDNNILLANTEADNNTFITNRQTISRIADSALFNKDRSLRINNPTIIVYKIKKENHLVHTRKVYFETYHPIGKLPRKYWPVEKFLNAYTNKPIYEYEDRHGKPTIAYETFLKNGKGNFRINTHKINY